MTKARYKSGRFAAKRFAAAKWLGGPGSTVVDVPDFMHGTLNVFPQLHGQLRLVAYLAGEHVHGSFSIMPNIAGRIETNP